MIPAGGDARSGDGTDDRTNHRAPDRAPVTGPVTLAVVNARVWTGDPRRPWADAVVARGEHLAFVGSAAEARKLTRDAPGARVVDAGGQFVAGAAGVLRTGAPADFDLLDQDPSRPDVTRGAGAPRPVLAVRGGQVIDDQPADLR